MTSAMPRSSWGMAINLPYRTVFDINGQGSRYTWIFAICFVLLCVCIAVLVLHGTGRRRMPAARIVGMVAVFLGVMMVPAIDGYQQTQGMREALRTGRYTVVEGRVEELGLTTTMRKDEERFVVHANGQTYSYHYRDAQHEPGYRQTERRGGFIRPGLRVRIADVGGRIARLEIAPEAGIGP